MCHSKLIKLLYLLSLCLIYKLHFMIGMWARSTDDSELLWFQALLRVLECIPGGLHYFLSAQQGHVLLSRHCYC